jgi:amino acid transporter
VTTPAAIGALATFFGELLLGMVGPAEARAWAVPAVASATILILSGINLLGARPGSAVQTFFTVVKVAALLVLMAFSFTTAAGQLRATCGRPRPGPATSAWAPPP